MVDLAREWDRLLMARVSDEDPPVEPVLEAKSVLRPGASPAAIAAAEGRIGAQLPTDYKEFLAFSDGAFADVGDAIAAYGAPHLEFSRVYGAGLLPVADVDRLDRIDPRWIDAFSGEEFLLEETEPPFDGQLVSDCRPIVNAVVISSGFNGSLQLVLVPVADRWEVWDCYLADPHRYLSFRNWLAWRIRSLDST